MAENLKNFSFLDDYENTFVKFAISNGLFSENDIIDNKEKIKSQLKQAKGIGEILLKLGLLASFQVIYIQDKIVSFFEAENPKGPTSGLISDIRVKDADLKKKMTVKKSKASAKASEDIEIDASAETMKMPRKEKIDESTKAMQISEKKTIDESGETIEISEEMTFDESGETIEISSDMVVKDRLKHPHLKTRPKHSAKPIDRKRKPVKKSRVKKSNKPRTKRKR